MIAEEGIDNRFGSSKPPDAAEAIKIKETLDEEIHQVIFKEALNEAVMELALNDGEDCHDSLNQDSFLPHVEINDDYETFTGSVNVDEEENDAKIGSGEEDGVYDEKLELNGNIENEGSKEQEMYKHEQQGTESVGDHVVNNKNHGYSGVGGINGGRSYMHPIRPNAEDYGGGSGGGWINGGRSYMHPIRPDAEDCAFYMKTGNCKYGATCKFNHSTIRKNQQGIKEKPKTKAEYMEQPGLTECKYYLTPGGCKYGESCKYIHKRERFTAAPVLEFNFLGLPIRLGEKECPYYMRHGSCKYGSNCIFNHPHPASAAAIEPTPNYGNGGSVWFQNSAQSTPSSWSTLQMPFPPNQHIPLSNPVWNGYSQGHVYPTPERSLPTPPAFSVNNPAAETNCFSYHQQQMPIDEYPERPGQPECSHFLKTGDCKFKSCCRFHHPKTRISNSMSFALSDKGLPLRPDQSICSYYNRYGICKFGPACKFDHPENWGNSASSGGAVMGRNDMK